MTERARNGNGGWKSAALTALGALLIAILGLLAEENREWRQKAESRLDAIEQELSAWKAQRKP